MVKEDSFGVSTEGIVLADVVVVDPSRAVALN